MKLSKLSMWSLYAGDPDQSFILIFLPFLCRLDDGEQLIGKEIVIHGIVQKSCPYAGESLPAVKVFRCEVVRDIVDRDPQSIPVASSKEQTKYLKELYKKQPTKERQLGLANESLGWRARQDLEGECRGFTSRWTGVTAYLGQEPQGGADFEDSFEGVSHTDEYKNTNGEYYLSQYVKNPDKDHYTIGAVKSDDATENYLKSCGKSCLIIGQQIDEFPFNDDGGVKEKFRAAYSEIKSDLLRRLVLPVIRLMQYLRGTSNYHHQTVSFPKKYPSYTELLGVDIDGVEAFADIRIPLMLGFEGLIGLAARGFARPLDGQLAIWTAGILAADFGHMDDVTAFGGGWKA
ncbi:MAG: hypothetical protein JRM94_03185 [Nitrososphaerota archaeon]|nr:hypothetical protein [Nitrososphaerota archaeon]